MSKPTEMPWAVRAIVDSRSERTVKAHAGEIARQEPQWTRNDAEDALWALSVPVWEANDEAKPTREEWLEAPLPVRVR